MLESIAFFVVSAIFFFLYYIENAHGSEIRKEFFKRVYFYAGLAFLTIALLSITTLSTITTTGTTINSIINVTNTPVYTANKTTAHMGWIVGLITLALAFYDILSYINLNWSKWFG